ncbi:MAG: hypothetical protein N2508_15460 [Anaerolineae bacterium]|nr:hypothetical protein [Anaerolineae bacterium]
MRSRTELATKLNTQLAAVEDTGIAIHIAACRCGLDAQLVRYYVDIGVVSWPLTEAGLAELRRIRRLIGLGVNLAGVEIILRMRRRIEELLQEVEYLRGMSVAPER